MVVGPDISGPEGGDRRLITRTNDQRPMTKDPRHVRLLAGTALLVVLGCAGRPAELPPGEAPIRRASPLPTAGLSGAAVAVYPLTLMSADQALNWREQLAVRRTALDRADSVIAEALKSRSPEVPWVLPDVMRRGAKQAPGMLADPDQIATSLLRATRLEKLSDPLWSQMRALSAVAGARFALVPAALFYFKTPEGLGRAELTLVLADTRSGVIGWRTIAEGEANDPWQALWMALKQLTPGMP